MNVTTTFVSEISREARLTYMMSMGHIHIGNTMHALSIIPLPLNIFVISVLLVYLRSANIHQNSFYFIINLAITDIFGSILNIIFINLNLNTWSHQNCEKIKVNAWSYELNCGRSDPAAKFTLAPNMILVCSWQIGLFTFSYLNTVLATGFLSLDRFLFIYKPLKYSITMTNAVIRLFISISWIFPVFCGMLTFVTSNVDQLRVCIPTHGSK